MVLMDGKMLKQLQNFKSEPSYAFVFKDFKSTLEFFMAPFLVKERETIDQNVGLICSKQMFLPMLNLVLGWRAVDRILISYMGSSIASDFRNSFSLQSKHLDVWICDDGRVLSTKKSSNLKKNSNMSWNSYDDKQKWRDGMSIDSSWNG
nr:protein trichome birefringence-like [Tanacetum cinerariifolium]